MTMIAASPAQSLDGPSLEHYPAVLTQSPDEARQLLHSAYGLQDLTVVGNKSEFFVQTNHKATADISLIYSAFGGTVELDFPQADFARQLFCFSGIGVVRGDKTDPVLQIDQSLPLPIRRPLRLCLTENFRQIALRISEAALVKKLTALLGSEPGMPIQLDWNQPGGEAKKVLRNLVMYLAREIHSLEKCSALCPVISELEQTIVTTFLYANQSNYSALLRTAPKDAGPWQVCAVEEFISSHWKEPIDMLQLVKVTGASARSIFQAFAQARGYSPKVFLKRTRLTHARAMLQSSDPGTSVTAIALLCGFHNLGHFARDYREYFGELPSETLAKQRIKRPISPQI